MRIRLSDFGREDTTRGGELAGNRTQDPRLKRALLYQLSYELATRFSALCLTPKPRPRSQRDHHPGPPRTGLRSWGGASGNLEDALHGHLSPENVVRPLSQNYHSPTQIASAVRRICRAAFTATSVTFSGYDFAPSNLV
jgi:hypothetical protein